MTRMSGAQAVVAQLKREGVRYAFTVPGESFLSVLDALHDEPSFTLVATRHEGGAAFMAEAVGKLTGTPALCMATRGVGSANMAIALHTAFQDSTPLIALIGQVETPHRNKEAFQEVELAPFFAHIVKWTVEVERTDRLPALIHEAIRRAISGRPGPVLLAVPTDVLNAEYDFSADHFRTAAVTPRPAPTATDAAHAVDLLLNAERPVMLVGGGVLRAGATDALVAFAEATGIPVIVGFRRYHAFPNNHPLFLGSMGLGAPSCVRARLQEADVLLALGTRLSEFTTGAYTVPAPQTQSSTSTSMRASSASTTPSPSASSRTRKKPSPQCTRPSRTILTPSVPPTLPPLVKIAPSSAFLKRTDWCSPDLAPHRLTYPTVYASK